MLSKFPQSCDTFVVLPPLTDNNTVVFGKNSDRPRHEVQEIALVKGGIRDTKKLKCTYITIDEVSPVHTVILSKPAWMWGAEMGANDKNVVIGNEAVWTNNNEGEGDAQVKRLLGMDLVRLGLERADTAEGAVDVITSLLEKYGQGGPCSEYDDRHFYHNSFIIADPKEAWVLETSGKIWAAEKVDGYRNISNGLTITTKIDKHTENLVDKTKELRLWDGKGEFNFMRCYSSGGDETRQREGTRLLREATVFSSFQVQDMMNILRHKESRICRGLEDSFPTQGSQVSCLSATNINVHWFTATPDPSVSFYKPFIFTQNARVPPEIISPIEETLSRFIRKPKETGLLRNLLSNEMATCFHVTNRLLNPRREHTLYKMHVERRGTVEDAQTTRGCKRLEAERLAEMTKYLNTPAGQALPKELDNLLKDCVDAEVNLYFEDTDDEEERAEEQAEIRAAIVRTIKAREERIDAELAEAMDPSDEEELINFYEF